MKKVNLFLIVIIISLTVSFFTFYIYQKSRIVQINKFPMDVRVAENQIIGFNVDPDGFHFGSVPRGSGGQRELRIHQVEEDVIVYMYKKGEIAPWVSYPNSFTVRKGESKNITLSVSIPREAKPGNYSGEITVILKKP